MLLIRFVMRPKDDDTPQDGDDDEVADARNGSVESGRITRVVRLKPHKHQFCRDRLKIADDAD